MNPLNSRIYLASQNPRYRESLAQIGVGFEMLLLRTDPRRELAINDVQEADETVQHYLERICCATVVAGQHALVSRSLRAYPVLAADAILETDGSAVGKPHDQKASADMLRALSGRQHLLTSAVAVAFQARVACRLTTTNISFATLTDERIRRYVMANEGRDRAGAYAVEGLGGAFVSRIEGSHSALFGLPLFETVELLSEFDLSI
ncbi:MAG: Maf family protein [Rhodoferax sp.]|uniref:Maf family protein n=1 Tax=Rhodoferax sp. TaxID=50421 RepID=UPI002606B689|nr:Maf family protein [Rhodoferax sp.]MDD2881352.1 Maf family protein [Rhodoferax sp.]